MFYYELCYFYSREDSGSSYVESETDMEKFFGEDEFLDYLIENKKIAYELAQQIIQINEITKEEYESFKC